MNECNIQVLKDSVKLYELFDAPYDKLKFWNR